MSSSAKRALKVLAQVGEAGRPMGVTEIARAIKISPGTAFRALDALQRANLTARHPSAPRYVLGPLGSGLRQSLLSLFRIRDVCLPYLRQLASVSGETCSLHVRIGWYAARIASAPGAAEVTSAATLSGAQALFAGFAGRAMLAHLDRPTSARHRAWASAHGHAGAAGLERELAAVRARGFARSSALDALAPGGVAFPIRKSDQAFAAIAVEGPGFAEGPAKAVPPAAWREIATAVEALVRANPALANQPFQHLDPDEVALPS